MKDTPQSNKQHAVPQNIMDVEFKLIGDLTMRQFIYLFVFGGVAYVISVSVVGFFKWPMVIILCLIGLALAFVPVQERGMDEWMINFVRAVYSPNRRIWKKEPVLPAVFSYQSLAVVKQELITLAPTSSRRKLEEYLEVQTKQQIVDPLDIPEREFILKVRNAYATVAAPVAVARDFQTIEPSVGNAFEHPAPISQPIAPPTPGTTTSTQTQPPVQQPQVSHTNAVPQPDMPKERVVVKETAKLKLPLLRRHADGVSGSDDVPLSPLTPDRHAGRRFTRLLPSQGDLILPTRVRGEKVLKTTEELDIQKEIEDKTRRLNELLDSLKKEGYAIPEKREQPAEVVAQQVSTPKPEQEKVLEVRSKAFDVADKVQEQNVRITEEIKKLKQDLVATPVPPEDRDQKERLLDALKKEQVKASHDYAVLQKQILDLQKRLADKEHMEDPREPQVQAPTYSKMQAITSEPNIISGIVRGAAGNALEGVVMLIKNSSGEPVRALKTNSLGQFAIGSPLGTGLYSVEADPSNVPGQTFDIITVEVKGEVIPPIEISGKNI